jgi:mono/diheme cytochrome c family protein
MASKVKRALSVVGGLLVLAIGGVTTKFFVLSPKSRAPQDVHAPTTPEAIARGKYLATNVAVCLGCHSKLEESKPGHPMVEGMAGSGRDFGPEPGFPGRIRTANLTPDKQFGIGNWTDGEVLRAMREGIGKDGHALFPMMPYKNLGANLSDDDGLAIIAYLRSLPPIANDPGKTEINFPVSMFIRAAPAPLEKSAGAPPTDPMGRGKWLLGMGNCNLCHDSFDSKRQPLPGMHFAGGEPFSVPQGKVYAANITSDKATGIGAYSDEDLMRVFNEGIGKAGRPLLQMPWAFYKGMTDDDKKALILALRDTPPVNHPVPPPDIK